ncbi:MAG: hypothetical protein ACE5II_04225, partial [Anaerolineae bacterium]
LTRPGFFLAHSGFLPVLNLFDLETTLPGLGWAPRIGEEYNLFTSEGPLSYALAEAFRLLGMSGAQAVKGGYASGFLLSGLAIYALARRLFGPHGGLIAALVYTYLPYHLAVVYLRGAFAESVAFVLFPLLLWAVDVGLKENGRFALAVLALLFAALALTQAGLALLYALFLWAYIFALGPSREAKVRTASALGTGVGLGFLLLLPLILKGGYVVGPGPDFSRHFLYPFQLFSPTWKYGLDMGWKGGFPFQLGAVATGLALLSLFALSKGEKEVRGKTLFFLVGAGVMALLTLGPARLFWETTRLSWLLAYPWQLLTLIGLCTSVAAGGLLALEPRLARYPWRAALVGLIVLGSYNYLSPRFTDFEIKKPAQGILGNKVVLLDYKLEGPLRHGATIRLTLYWQALKEMEKDYTVFVHVVDEEGSVWGQWDSQPVSGERPTSGWERGEVIEDAYKISIDVEGPREGYEIKVGMYLVETGERLPTEGDTFIFIEPKGEGSDG